MPRPRTDVARGDKIDAIIEAAAAQIRSGGHENLSIQGIARELGVARAAVSWYFPSKHDLFVAVATRVLSDAFSRPPSTKSPEGRIEWAVDTLYALRPFYFGLQERARQHPAAAEVLSALQLQMCDRLHALLEGRVASRQVVLTSDTIVIFIEGLLTRELDQRARHRYVRHLLASLLGAADA